MIGLLAYVEQAVGWLVGWENPMQLRLRFRSHFHISPTRRDEDAHLCRRLLTNGMRSYPEGCIVYNA